MTRQEPRTDPRRRPRRLLRASLIAGLAIAAAVLDAQPFGSEADYLGAFLWGSGVDAGTRGLGTVLDTVKSLATK